jgi:hypothetical protein
MMKGSRCRVAKNRAAVAYILTKGLAGIRAASRKAHDSGAFAPKPVITLAMLWWFSGFGYPSYSGRAAQGTSFGGWLGVVGFESAQRQWWVTKKAVTRFLC